MKLHRSLVSTLVATAIVAIGLVSHTGVARADTQVPALACQAPYLDQAFRLRWHEHYLHSEAGNPTTWVVCPITLETDNIGANFEVWVTGIRESTASGFPLCFVNVVSLWNENAPFYQNQARNYKAIYQLQELNTGRPALWVHSVRLSRAQVEADVGDGRDVNWYTFSINCRLPPQISMQMISVF